MLIGLNAKGIIDHPVRFSGDGVVAVGSDCYGFAGAGSEGVPKDLKSPRGHASLRQAMLLRYSESQVATFLSGNAERVLRTGWGR